MHTPRLMLAPTLAAAIASAALAQTPPSAPAPSSSTPTAQSPALPPAATTPPAVDLTKDPTLYVVGYAHLDTQWRWTYADTIREYLPNTLRDNFKHFEKYPGYVFNFSGSRRYKMMEEYYPADFEKLRGYIAAGRWFPCGSSVDENDANVPSAEALVRHMLYGNTYFRNTFGIASDEYMLPDCFGFPAALPSVLAHCGIKGFSTQKLTWGGVVPIPFKVGMWEGPDGRAIAAALDPGAYVGQVKDNLATSDSWKTRIANNGKASGVFADYHYFGTGDQGGAPDEPSVAMVEKSIHTQGNIKVISGPADWLFKALTPDLRDKLPRYKGELMLTEHSAGSISSQAYMKRWNRKNELLAGAAESAAVAATWLGGRTYPAQRLEDAWYLVLGSQMHDILPGTSVPKAYEYSWNDEVLAGNMLGAVLRDSVGAIAQAMDTGGSGRMERSIVVFNPTPFPRRETVEVRDGIFEGQHTGDTIKVLYGPAGNVPFDSRPDRPGKPLVTCFVADVAPMSLTAYRMVEESEVNGGPDNMGHWTEPGQPEPEDRILENDLLRATINDNGDVASIIDKRTGQETLSAPMTLSLNYENPSQWPAWNQDWADRQKPPTSIVAGPAKIELIDTGPIRRVVQVTRHAEGSTFVQRITLASGSERLEFDITIDWRTKERSLRAAFPLIASNPLATFDIQTGVVQRPNSHAKQYEYSFHQWMDLTDTSGAHGASILCDSKYAADKPDDRTLRLTLLYTPGVRGGYVDQSSQDLGRHHIRYAVMPHAGDWRAARTHIAAANFNQPLIAFNVPSHPGPLGKAFSFAQCSDPAVSITALKKAEASDETIVRLREHLGSTAKDVRISFPARVLSAREVDGQEREIGPATVRDGALVADVPGFSLRAFALKLAPPEAPVAAITSTPITLPFDCDVFASRAAPTDGQMTASGGAYPAEMLPRTITHGGVQFQMGPTADGQLNALACRGQTIELPKGDYDTVCVLAAAESEPHDSHADAFPHNTWKYAKLRRSYWHLQAWDGFIGQWDCRQWPGDTSAAGYAWSDPPTGLTPGFIKPVDVAWYASHRRTPTGDAFYQYCYIFAHRLAIKPDTRTITLPDDPTIKVFAMSAAHFGGSIASEEVPPLDDLSDHVQDAPIIAAEPGPHADSLDVAIEPGLYWRSGAIRYTTDGMNPGPASPVYQGPVRIDRPLTLSATVIDAAGVPGPIASMTFNVADTTPPRLAHTSAAHESPFVRLTFSEPLDPSAADPTHYHLDPAIPVTAAEIGADHRSVRLTLAAAPTADQPYSLSVSGVKDASPAANTLAHAEAAFTVHGPIYTIASITAADAGKTITDIPGLPVKAADAWTINVFIRTDKQPENRTVIAGFGTCADTKDGAARYLCKFASGLRFWSRNRDVSTRSPLKLNAWQMLTATYDGTTLRVYHDGKRVGASTVQLTDDDNTLHILPKDPWEHKRQFEGDIRQLSIWNTALSDDGIEALLRSTPSE